MDDEMRVAIEMVRDRGGADTINDLGVGVRSGGPGAGDVVIVGLGARLRRDQAIRMAAWIVALTGPDEFKRCLDAIKKL